MTEEDRIRLFLYNCAVVQSEISDIVATHEEQTQSPADNISGDLKSYVTQFDSELREKAIQMSTWYALFYMLENDIRDFIRDILSEKDSLWWDNCVSEKIRNDVELNRLREQEFAFNARSDDPLDYTTFGQLGDIIRENWDVFGGVMSNQKAMGRVMATLNTLRGPIAHCGTLAADEIDRLKLTLKDWFRVVAGPQ